MIGYKLLRKRKDGSLGPLFIERKLRIAPGFWYRAKTVPTKGFAVRHGFHVCQTPSAPHLTMKGRVWCLVEFRPIGTVERPESQGGIWWLAEWMKVIKVLEHQSHA